MADRPGDDVADGRPPEADPPAPGVLQPPMVDAGGADADRAAHAARLAATSRTGAGDLLKPGRDRTRELARTGSTGALSRIADLAARLLRAQAAQVSVISDEQEVVGAAGHAVPSLGVRSPAGDSLCTVTVRSGHPVIVADAEHDPRVVELPPVASGMVGAYLGVPLVASNGLTIGALCVFEPEPREWSEQDVSLLQELAGPAVAELELASVTADYEDDRVIWQLAVDAAGVGAFDWDLERDDLRWDDRLLDLFGLDRESFGGTIGAFNQTLHPEDLPRVSAALEEAIHTCGGYEAEYRVLLPSGEVRWVAARGRALAGPDGVANRLLGAAYDTTAVREGEARVARIMESMPTAFFQLDRSWRFSYANAEAERLLGRSRSELRGGVIWDLFPAAVGSVFEEHYTHAMDSGEPVAFEAYYPPPLDSWYEVRAWPSPDGLAVYFTDITAAHEARQQLDQAARRGEILAEVTGALVGTLVSDQAIRRMTPMLVPTLGDWCVVTIVDDHHPADWRRAFRDVGFWHADPERRELVAAYAGRRFAGLVDDSFLGLVLEAETPTVVEGGATERLQALMADREVIDLVGRLAPQSFAAAPLRARGRTVGLISAFRDAGREPFSSLDIDLLADIGARAGLALDNARLYEEQRDLAEALQRSMLTPPPESEDLQTAVRYVPAADVAQVGGDWYDAFLQPDGVPVIVIGDVVGHDLVAAAAMGQVRSLLRGIAFHGGGSPGAVLRGVDEAITTLQPDTTATAVVARLECSEDGTCRLRWSNAGHPPPVVVRPDGRVEVLTTDDPDLLLGVDPTVERGEQSTEVEVGGTVLLFTDGLVERRGLPLDEGLHLITRTLDELGAADLPLEHLCDRLLERLLTDDPEDDVALVAVRVRDSRRSIH